MTIRSDILVAGAGAAGLTTAIALAGAGFSVTVAGGLDTRRNGRTVALFEASVRLYRSLGLWERLEPLSMPLRRIRLADDTGSLFRLPPVELEAAEIGLPAFGANIENAALVEALATIARGTPGVEIVEGMLGDYATHDDSIVGRLSTGESLSAALLVGADGRGSQVRTYANVGPREWRYKQTAITALLRHEKPHRATSTEFHTRSGPCTLVPMRSDDEAPEGLRHRSSLVWLMTPDEAERRMALSDEELVAEIEEYVHGIHGRMGLVGPRGAFPMAGLSCDRLVAERIALVADAGHYFPPIGAQGLNLGLRDVAQLIDSLEKHGRIDAGDKLALADYDKRRRGDVATRTLSVDLMNRSLLIHALPVDFMRSAGLAAMAAIGPLRRALMREGVAPPGRLPRLMREPARRRA
jgi:2-octaprenyl-6-methoxyphenol hydroxylase